MDKNTDIRQKLINILWGYDGLSENEIMEIVNKIVKKLELE